jgi:hypothetical protein
MLIEIRGEKEKILYIICTEWYSVCDSAETLSYLGYNSDGTRYIETLNIKSVILTDDKRLIVYV